MMRSVVLLITGLTTAKHFFILFQILVSHSG
jgi:hypothetical protein